MARSHDIDDILEAGAEKLRDRVEEVRDRVEEAADKVKDKSEEAWKDAVKFVQKHPAQSIGVALVVGAALGVILFGRSRD